MFFSKILINPQRRNGKLFLANPRVVHAAVEASFPPGNIARNLWRMDPQQHGAILYVVSPSKPDLRHIQEQAGWVTSPGQSLNYDAFLKSVEVGDRYAFRLSANPVKREFVQNGRGKILPHVTEAQQVQWLLSRAPKYGFECLITGENEQPDVRVIHRRENSFTKIIENEERGTVTQRNVTFTGRLLVTDKEAFVGALVHGIGRGKAYGCGLLTLAQE